MADEDKMTTIHELKAKFDANNSFLKQLESQRRQNEMSLRRAAITASQLDALPDATPCYRGIGRAYFLQPKLEVMSHLESNIKTCDAELKRATASRDALVSTQEALRKELTELIGAR